MIDTAYVTSEPSMELWFYHTPFLELFNVYNTIPPSPDYSFEKELIELPLFGCCIMSFDSFDTSRVLRLLSID